MRLGPRPDRQQPREAGHARGVAGGPERAGRAEAGSDDLRGEAVRGDARAGRRARRGGLYERGSADSLPGSAPALPGMLAAGHAFVSRVMSRVIPSIDSTLSPRSRA